MTTKVGLAKQAYQGAPQGFPRASWPNGEPVEHPSQWNREHWSFDDALKTRAKSKPHVPMTANEALNLIQQMMSATTSVGK